MNVALRAETPADEEVLFRLASELDTWEERNPSPPAPLTLETYRDRKAKSEQAGGAVFVITVDGEAVGRCTIFAEDALARHAEVGIALLPEARGKGIGTAALTQLVEFAFVRRNLRRVHLVAIGTNLDGIGCYRKVGFVEEGRRREHCWVRGEYVDEIIMGLLRSDWDKQR
jgi:RimJ/RimL family protein N-acetyltransferase